MSHRLQVVVPEALAAKVASAARRCGLSQGEWIRRVIERALAAPTDAIDPLARLSSLGAPTADIDDMIEQSQRGRR